MNMQSALNHEQYKVPKYALSYLPEQETQLTTTYSIIIKTSQGIFAKRGQEFSLD